MRLLLYPALAFALLLLANHPTATADESVSVATWNLEWFFDADTSDNDSKVAAKQSAPSQDEWVWKLNSVAAVIAKLKPTILGLQEVEDREVLQQLTKVLKEQFDISYRIAFIEGWDQYTHQDVAFLYRTGLIEYSRKEQTAEMFQSKEYYNVHKHLFARFEFGSGKQREQLLLANVHLRATAEKQDIRIKQCRLLRKWISEELTAGNNVIVLGDLNTEEVCGSVREGSDLAILMGLDTKSQDDDLIDSHLKLQADYRDTHLGGRQFDRILISRSLIDDKRKKQDLSFVQIGNFKEAVVVGERDHNHFDNYYKIPQAERDVSDHYPIMVEFQIK